MITSKPSSEFIKSLLQRSGYNDESDQDPVFLVANEIADKLLNYKESECTMLLNSIFTWSMLLFNGNINDLLDAISVKLSDKKIG